MFPRNPSIPTKVGPERCNIAEAQGKDFKLAFMNVLEVLEGEINKSLKESLKTQTVAWNGENNTRLARGSRINTEKPKLGEN